MTDPILEYLSGWERIIRPDYPGVITFLRGDFMIHLIGKHDIRLTGKGFTGEMRFYDAARKVMELENDRQIGDLRRTGTRGPCC